MIAVFICALYTHAAAACDANCQQWAEATKTYSSEKMLDAPNQRISFASFPADAAVAMQENETLAEGAAPCSFVSERPGEKALCWIEKTTQDVAGRAFLPSDVILEAGSRYGTTSCFLASLTRNSGGVIAVDPDENVSVALLTNRHAHECSFWLVRGAVSAVPLRTNPDGFALSYGTRSIPMTPEESAALPEKTHFSIGHLEHATGLHVNALLIDCEGCIQYMFPDDVDLSHALRHIRAIVVEADMPCPGPPQCVNYTEWSHKLDAAGFDLVETTPDANLPWIDMLSFVRRAGYVHRLPQRSRRCVNMLATHASNDDGAVDRACNHSHVIVP